MLALKNFGKKLYKKVTMLRVVFAINAALYLYLGIQGLLFAKPYQTTLDENMTYYAINSLYAAFGILCAFGMKHPNRFVVLMVMQTIYLSLWLLTWAVPIYLNNKLSGTYLTRVIIAGFLVTLNLAVVPVEQVFPAAHKHAHQLQQHIAEEFKQAEHVLKKQHEG
jgi:uncharacterized membrane protein (DUF485 family)